MEIKFIKKLVDWDMVLATAKATQGEIYTGKMPSDKWKRKIMKSPHSPVRALTYFVQMTVPYYVQGHITRHKGGFEPFCGSQRNDRQDKYDRRAARQDTEVLMSFIVNGDALKFISRRRLCGKADPMTRKAWGLVIDAVCEIDPILRDYLVPECVMTGFCPEFQCCGFINTSGYKEARENLIKEIK